MLEALGYGMRGGEESSPERRLFYRSVRRATRVEANPPSTIEAAAHLRRILLLTKNVGLPIGKGDLELGDALYRAGLIKQCGELRTEGVDQLFECPASLANQLDRPPELRRVGAPVCGDAALVRWTSHACYQSAGQAEAVRAIAAAPERAVVLVSMPTGGGKSLCVQVPALQRAARRGRQGTAVVIVPTFALALDQRRAAQELRPWAGAGASLLEGEVLALTGAVSAARRAEAFARLASGELRLVFMSPEMALGSAREPLLKAARAGVMTLFAVDEAHLITTWGAKFRPEIQRLARFRSELVDEDPQLVTVLLSATVTPEGEELLRSLYCGEGDSFRHVDARALRAEHDYFVMHVRTAEDRAELVCRLAPVMPLPAIVYTTLVADAEELGARLRAGGWQSVRVFTGKTPDNERQEIIDAWRADELDIVVATSAFGLGVDKPDVRTVVHVTLPESIDRFYQEVGRGGRDGASCLSLVVRTEGDMAVAQKNALANLLTPELIAERWCSMLDTSEDSATSDGRLVYLGNVTERVSLQATRSGRTNAEWNAGALLLMERAGLIQIAAMDESPEWWRVELQRGADELRSQAWVAAAVREKREVEQQANRRALQSVSEGLSADSQRCTLEVVAETYGLPRGPACGRCPSCRGAAVRPEAWLGRIHIPGSWAGRGSHRLAHRAARLLGQSRYARGCVLWEDTGEPTMPRIMHVLCRALANDGVQQFLVPQGWDGALATALAEGPECERSWGIVHPIREDGRLGEVLGVPTVMVVARSHLSQCVSALERCESLAGKNWFAADNPILYALPRGLMNPSRPDRPLSELIQCVDKFTMQEYLSGS